MACQLVLVGRPRAEGFLDRVVGTLRRRELSPAQVFYGTRNSLQILLIELDTTPGPILDRVLAQLRRLPDILCATVSLNLCDESGHGLTVAVVSPADQTDFVRLTSHEGVRHIATVRDEAVFEISHAPERMNAFVQSARGFGQVWICSLASAPITSGTFTGDGFAAQSADHEEVAG